MRVDSFKDFLPISVTNLEFGYAENPLFKEFSLEIEKPGFYLLEPETHVNASIFLLRIMSGLSVPRNGAIQFSNQVVSEMSFEEFLPMRLKMSYCSDMGGLISNKTVKQNISLPLYYHKIFSEKEVKKRVNEAIEKFELTSVAHERPAELSRSDYKMALLIRSIIHNPAVLFLDEPEEALDSSRFELFVEELSDRYKKKSLGVVMYSSMTNRLLMNYDQYVLTLTRNGTLLKNSSEQVAV